MYIYVGSLSRTYDIACHTSQFACVAAGNANEPEKSLSTFVATYFELCIYICIAKHSMCGHLEIIVCAIGCG